MIWVLLVLPKAKKGLRKLDKKYQETALRSLEELEDDPKQGRIEKIRDQSGFRKRTGRVRIKFVLDDNLIIVFHIGLRDEKIYM